MASAQSGSMNASAENAVCRGIMSVGGRTRKSGHGGSVIKREPLPVRTAACRSASPSRTPRVAAFSPHAQAIPLMGTVACFSRRDRRQNGSRPSSPRGAPRAPRCPFEPRSSPESPARLTLRTQTSVVCRLPLQLWSMDDLSYTSSQLRSNASHARAWRAEQMP